MILTPPDAKPTPGVVEAVLKADLVVLGPGSIFTSIIPNLMVREVGDALRRTRAPVVLVANLVSERGEASGLGLPDHLEVIHDHAGGRIVDAAVVHEGPIDRATLDRYRDEGAHPLEWPKRGPRGITVVRRNLLGAGPKLRHDPLETAAALIDAWSLLSSGGD